MNARKRRATMSTPLHTFGRHILEAILAREASGPEAKEAIAAVFAFRDHVYHQQARGKPVNPVIRQRAVAALAAWRQADEHDAGGSICCPDGQGLRQTDSSAPADPQEQMP